MTILERIEAIIRDCDDSDFGDLAEIMERLAPLLRRWQLNHLRWERATAGAELSQRPLPVAVIGHFSEELRAIDRDLLALLDADAEAP